MYKVLSIDRLGPDTLRLRLVSTASGNGLRAQFPVYAIAFELTEGHLAACDCSSLLPHGLCAGWQTTDPDWPLIAANLVPAAAATASAEAPPHES